jgi:predicted Zn-dependent protease
MRKQWMPWLLLLTGCQLPATDESATRQVTSTPYPEMAQTPVITKVNYSPASRDTEIRVEIMRGKLIGENPQLGLFPRLTVIGAIDPEIFHVGMTQIYLTEGLVKQCQSDAQLAAVLANELGRMVSERESAVRDEIRSPDRLPPIHLPIGGNGNAQEADPINIIELAKYEKQFPRQPRKLTPPNPQLIARTVLAKAGFQTTELEAAMPIIQAAQQFSGLENQFKGSGKQSDWR